MHSDIYINIYILKNIYIIYIWASWFHKENLGLGKKVFPFLYNTNYMPGFGHHSFSSPEPSGNGFSDIVWRVQNIDQSLLSLYSIWVSC